MQPHCHLEETMTLPQSEFYFETGAANGSSGLEARGLVTPLWAAITVNRIRVLRMKQAQNWEPSGCSRQGVLIIISMSYTLLLWFPSAPPNRQCLPTRNNTEDGQNPVNGLTNSPWRETQLRRPCSIPTSELHKAQRCGLTLRL